MTLPELPSVAEQHRIHRLQDTPERRETPAERNKHGKAFEKLLNDAFYPLRLVYPVIWERIVDTAGAGNLMRKADGDYALTVRSPRLGQPFRFCIEAKASMYDETLATNFRTRIKADQVAKMRLQERAGVFGLYMSHSLVTKEVEVWQASVLNEAHPNKRVKLEAQPGYVCGIKNLGLLARLMCSQPGDFIRTMETV